MHLQHKTFMQPSHPPISSRTNISHLRSQSHQIVVPLHLLIHTRTKSHSLKPHFSSYSHALALEQFRDQLLAPMNRRATTPVLANAHPPTKSYTHHSRPGTYRATCCHRLHALVPAHLSLLRTRTCSDYILPAHAYYSPRNSARIYARTRELAPS